MDDNISVIKIERLKKCFGKFVAIDGLNFKVNAGEIHGFIGPNGAGKTTTIKCILNLLFATEGSIELFGINYLNFLARKKISYFPEKQVFPGKISTLNYLLFLAQASGLSKQEALTKINSLFTQFGLTTIKNKAPSSLSSGMKQKIL
jgi:ABC-2 type transport system ATP-binding protein